MKGNRVILKNTLLTMVLLLLSLPMLKLILACFDGSLITYEFTGRHAVLLLKSAALGGSVALTSAVIGFLFVLFIQHKATKTMRLFLGVFITLYFISPYIHALSWIRIIGVGSATFFKTWFVLSLYYVPLNSVILLLGFNAIDSKYVQMAQIYRENKSVVLHIILKMIKPYVLTSVTLVFLFVLSDFSVPSLFQLKTYSLEIYTTYSYGVGIKELLFVAMPLNILMLLGFFILLNQVKKMSFKTSGNSILRNTKFNWSKSEKIVIHTSVVLVFICMFVNVMSLVPKSGWLKTVLEHVDTLMYSIMIGGVTAIITLIILFLFRNRLMKKWIQILLLLPLMLPSGLLGVAIIGIFNQLSTYNRIMDSNALIVYAGVVKTMPIMFLVLKGSLETQNKALLDSGRIYQKNHVHRIINIDLPYFLLPLCATGFVGFAYMFSDISTSILLIPPGKQTMVLKIYSYLHYGSGDKIAALGSLVIILFSAMSIVLLTLLNKKRRYLR